MGIAFLSDFEVAGRKVLAFLHRRFGFDLCMVTRTDGDDWIVLASEDHGYGVAPGKVFRWADSFCSQMVKGNGPRVAPRSEEVPAYAAAPIGQAVQIRAYVGLPLMQANGDLFGTLCAIHPAPMPDSLLEDQELLEMLAALLSTILQAELRSLEQTRQAERLQAEALTDSMTELYNRRGWGNLLATEEARCRRYGLPAAILIIDLDELKLVNDTQGHAAGDALLVRTASSLRQATRSADVVSRIGGDEFGILSIECDRAGGEVLLQRIRASLADAGVKASIGLAVRNPSIGLEGAWEQADRRMYEEKRSGQSASDLLVGARSKSAD